MSGLLAFCTDWQQKKISNKTEAYLAGFALVFLALLPLAFVAGRIVVDGFATAIALLFLVRSGSQRDWRWLLQMPVCAALCVWVYSALLVTPFALDVADSVGRIVWLRYIVLFAAMIYWLSDYAQAIYKIAIANALLMALLCVDAWVQYQTGTSLTGNPAYELRLSGAFQSPVIGIFLAKISLPTMGLLLFMAWREKNGKHLSLWLALLCAIIATILLSNERTATLTFAIALVVMGGGIFIYIKMLRAGVALVAVILLCLVGGLMASQTWLQARSSESAQMMEGFAQSPYGQLWRASLMIWQEYPILGAGMKNFRVACPLIAAPQGITECSNLHPHNVYFEFLAEMGTMGLLGLIAMIFGFIYAIWQQHKKREDADITILTATALAVVVLHFFPFAASQSIFANWSGWLLWYSLGFAVMITRLQLPQHREKNHE